LHPLESAAFSRRTPEADIMLAALLRRRAKSVSAPFAS
jgi:hypothetical protein